MQKLEKLIEGIVKSSSNKRYIVLVHFQKLEQREVLHISAIRVMTLIKAQKWFLNFFVLLLRRQILMMIDNYIPIKIYAEKINKDNVLPDQLFSLYPKDDIF